ncbi:MAG TPA: alpha/beta hydrolase [Thermomicrobiales bacterium]|nr:alpha/beta hydrolase [Thermomicrobiales bacterium]
MAKRGLVEATLEVAEGRTIRYYDTNADDGERLVVFWHHGTPNIGTPPEPLIAVSEELGIRWVSYDRPGYGGSTPVPNRGVSSVAADVAAVVDELGIEQFATMGHSGGGPHALACAALLPDRVSAVATLSGLAPLDAEGLDWFAGMYPGGATGLRAAIEGRAAKERHEASASYDPEMFTPEDHAALAGSWSWFDCVVGPAMEAGPGPLIDDDLAYVTPWGFDPTVITAPTLILHGGRDRIVPSSHGEWLAGRIPSAELWRRPEDGHISILHSGPQALAWLREHASNRTGLRDGVEIFDTTR